MLAALLPLIAVSFNGEYTVWKSMMVLSDIEANMVKAVRLLQERKTSSEDQTVIGSEDEDDTDVDDNDDDDIPVARLLFSG